MHKVRLLFGKSGLKYLRTAWLSLRLSSCCLRQPPYLLSSFMPHKMLGLLGISESRCQTIVAFCSEELTMGECFQVYMVSQFLIMFMMIPLSLSRSISLPTRWLVRKQPAAWSRYWLPRSPRLSRGGKSGINIWCASASAWFWYLRTWHIGNHRRQPRPPKRCLIRCG